jgi:hypothetical protein
MAPKKKKGEEDTPWPPLEDEVELPEGLEAVPEPSFCLVLGHVQGHVFVVEEPAKEEGLPGDQKEFDPVAELVDRAKRAEEPPINKRICVIERAELEAMEREEGAPLASALHKRLEKERESRMRSKSNAARRAAIEAFQRANAEGEEEVAADGGKESAEPPLDVPRADFCIILKDYPANAAELQEIAAQGFGSSGLVDLWTQIYFAGETLGLEDQPIASFETPDLVRTFYAEIHAAQTGTDLADFTVCMLQDSQELITPRPLKDPRDCTVAERVQLAVLERLDFECTARMRYRRWIQEPVRIKPPTANAVLSGSCETRLYNRLMSSVDPSHHDVSLFLHCITEQVQLDLEPGAVQQLEDGVALTELEKYLSAANDDALADGSTSPPQLTKASPRPATCVPEAPMPMVAPEDSAVAETCNVPGMLAFLDKMSCDHFLGADGGIAANLAKVGVNAKAAGTKVMDAVTTAVEWKAAPGVRRSTLPSSTVHSEGQREAVRSRFHPFAPDLSSPEMEQLFLMYGFQELFSKAAHERPWDFSGRVCRERIPKELLQQTLSTAFQTEPQVNSTYLPRYDCLLIGLHWRPLQGNAMWHSWRGDLLSPADSGKWEDGVFTLPTYNDWADVLRGRTGDVPQPKYFFEGLDARQIGYVGSVEKLATPADGSKILVTRLEHGITESFAMPSNLPPCPEVVETLTKAETCSQATTDVQSTTGAIEASRPTRFDAPSRYSSRVARVLKDGLVFGISTDTTYKSDAPSAELGSFWLALPRRSRCTVRMHHEQGIAQCGTLFTYTMTTGQIVQVFGDGSVCLSWPLHLLHGSSISEPDARPADIENQTHFVPGCPEDLEQSRTIMPFGTIVRKLISGRVEVLHPDGTTATRNPTTSELTSQIEQLARAGLEKGRLEKLRRFNVGLEDLGKDSRTQPYTKKEKAAGLPGHWVVVRADGSVFGRLPVASQEDNAAAQPNQQGENEAGDDAGNEAAVDQGEVDEVAEAAPGEMHDPSPSKEELLGGYLIDNAEMDDGSGPHTVIEYEIAPVSKTMQHDLQTMHKTFTNARGLASFEDADGTQKLCAHPDGTQVLRTSQEDGYEVAISKEPFAMITCRISTTVRVTVECADGARLDIVPQKAQGGKLVQLGSKETDFAALSKNAYVSLRTASAIVVSEGAGQVKLETSRFDLQQSSDGGNSPGSCYIASCDKNLLCLQDDNGDTYEIHGDQTLSLPSLAEKLETDVKSPRCLATGSACIAIGAKELTLPAEVPKPRLIVVYGDGEAEELLEWDAVKAELAHASNDPLSTLVENQPASEVCEGCVCHTIFRTRQPDTHVPPPAPTLALPDGLEVASSVYSMATASQHSQERAPVSSLVEYRQFIQYPEVDELTRKKFRGTLKQYRDWETEQLKKAAIALQGPQDKKKDKKADKKAATEKGEKAVKEKKGKGKRNRVSTAQEQVAEVVEPDPTFLDDLKLTAFEHEAKALLYRSKQVPEPSNQDLLKVAVTARADVNIPDPQETSMMGQDQFGDIGATDLADGTERDFELPDKNRVVHTSSSTRSAQKPDDEPDSSLLREKKPSEVVKVNFVVTGVDYNQLTQSMASEMRKKAAEGIAKGAGVRPSQVTVELSQGSVVVDATVDPAATSSVNTIHNTITTSPSAITTAVLENFSTIEGLPPTLTTTDPIVTIAPKVKKERSVRKEAPVFSYFQHEAGIEFLRISGELDSRKPRKVKGATSRRKAEEKKHSPWNPRLVGDDQPEDEEVEHREPEALHEEDMGDPGFFRPGVDVMGGLPGQYRPNFTEERLPYGYPIDDVPRPVQPEMHANPVGPHPDKRGPEWDIYGQEKPGAKKVSQACVIINKDYLEIEGSTDRRVRTVSVVQKKNAAKAPSVSAIRKTGLHAIGRTPALSAKDILGDACGEIDEHWKVSSTMQGLGNSSMLVDVRPGQCRFGPLRKDSLYRMSFFFRNLDVDVTRFTISPSESDYVHIDCERGHLAPGIASKVTVYVKCLAPKKIEQVVELRVKAHIVRVPVTARIFDAEEYDRLDAESLALHGRRIGRHRERSEDNKPGPVELVTDSDLHRRIMKTEYKPPPPDFAADMERSQASAFMR